MGRCHILVSHQHVYESGGLMPALAAFLANIFGGFAAWIAVEVGKWITKKGTVRVFAGGGIVALTAALVATFNALISPMAAAMFSTQYGQFLGLAFPPIAGTCIATIITAWTAVHVYRFKRRRIDELAR